MNLPEGALRERLRLAFAKATGTFDDFDLLAIVGRSQVGRIRYTGDKERLNEDVPFQSVDEILASRRDGDLFRYLIEKFAAFSGISGVQPKTCRGIGSQKTEWPWSLTVSTCAQMVPTGALKIFAS
jgi:serine/threonine-protein kinase HipA